MTRLQTLDGGALPAGVEWPPTVSGEPGNHSISFRPHGSLSAAAESDRLVRILRPDAPALDVPVGAVHADGEVLAAQGTCDGWSVRVRWRLQDEPECRLLEADMEVSWNGPADVTAGLRLEFVLPGASDPRWLIPGAFYRQNRPADCPRPFPRHDPAATTPGSLASAHWAFRADRAAVGAVFGWTPSACVGLAAEEVSELGLGGVGLHGDGRDASLWLDLPYREEPVRYDGSSEGRPAVATYARWHPGRTVRLAWQVYLGAPEPHGYDPFLRLLARRRRSAHPLRPWVHADEAAALAAHGLRTWHFRRLDHEGGKVAILAETAGFDREAGDGRGGSVDRLAMHVGWVSGTPWATALLRYGRERGDEQAVAAGEAVLDTIARDGLAPCGTFWGQWRIGGGWGGGWNPSGWIHARTVSEATLFLVRAVGEERSRGRQHPEWEAAARSSLAFAAARQAPDGGMGLYYDPRSGEVTQWGTAAGLPWIAALLAGARTLGEPLWEEAARRAGGHYAPFVLDGWLTGAVEDVPSAPTSEDGYAAIMAFVALHEADPAGDWLSVARRAADWTMTYRYAWNVPFASDTLLGRYDFRTRGGDQASSCNQHVHAYGLVCLPEMLALWRATGDDAYLERTRDNLACFLQLVARRDGDFNARKGMVSERPYQTDCFGPQGGLLTLSHAWSVGVLLHAALAAAGEPAMRFVTDVEGRTG